MRGGVLFARGLIGEIDDFGGELKVGRGLTVGHALCGGELVTSR